MTADDFDSAAALSEVKEAIATAERDAARREGSVTLVAVSKVHGADRIVPVLQAGHRVFGENRVQEAQGKWPALKERFAGVELHLIGPLQSNKAGDAVALFDVIETVDREKIARALAAEMDRQGRRVPVLVQVNTGKEPQKAGIDPEDADAFIARCRDDYGLEVRGVMCIPPVDEEPALHFALLREIARRNGLPVLSMGMSDDYPTAIALGATHVRVGTAVFGHRPVKG
ncbi:Putative protein YggS [Caenispirillum salinarum AK4]|uniref:Pyridoxal phosphate homeostasis protein n=1 Tax=Caenispirillum salinarum AK4 TaxID=1238182 RepID=K9H1T3_9PROT|nr:YggS family pyridoxal phosphate-dependent enzyme [Caenispirillum salinarum]EKV32185.1 Putative protein YggS [Caenispirillum salinarum AK4]